MPLPLQIFVGWFLLDGILLGSWILTRNHYIKKNGLDNAQDAQGVRNEFS